MQAALALRGPLPRAARCDTVVPMAFYRCYFLDEAGSTTAWEPLDLNSDVEARARAIELLAEHERDHFIEVWDAGTCIFRYERAVA